MDGSLKFHTLFYSIAVISGEWKGGTERLCAIKACLLKKKNSTYRNQTRDPPDQQPMLNWLFKSGEIKLI